MEGNQNNLRLTVLKLLTNITQENRKKNKAMQRTKNYNSKVHPKVEYPENLRVCKGKDWYTNDLGECDSTEDL